MALENAKAVAYDAIAMKALFDCQTEESIHHLSICALDSVLRAPGGMDIFLSYFVPAIQQINAEMDRQQPQPQQNYRQTFPAPPEMGGGQRSDIGLSQVPPSERWKYF